METQNPNPELLIKIKEKIKKETPHGRGYAKFISAVRISLVAILVVISTLSLSIFLTDILQKLQGGELENYSFLQSSLSFLFEFLIITLLGITAVYVVYRNTDWPFVKEKLRLIVGSFVLISLLSTGIVMLSESEETALGNFLDGVKDRIEDSLPFRTLLENDNQKNGYEVEQDVEMIEKI